MIAALTDVTSHLLRHPFNSSSFVRDRMGKEHPCSSIAAQQHWLAWSATDIPEKTIVCCDLVLDRTLVGIPSSVRKVGCPCGHAKLAPTAKKECAFGCAPQFLSLLAASHVWAPCAGSHVLPYSLRTRPHTRYLGHPQLQTEPRQSDLRALSSLRFPVRRNQCLASISTLPTKTRLRSLLDPSAKQIHPVFSLEVQPSPRINAENITTFPTEYHHIAHIRQLSH